jgi:hypothetical protein
LPSDSVVPFVVGLGSEREIVLTDEDDIRRVRDELPAMLGRQMRPEFYRANQLRRFYYVNRGFHWYCRTGSHEPWILFAVTPW